MADRPNVPITWVGLTGPMAAVLEAIVRQVPIDGVPDLANQLPGATVWEHHEGEWTVRLEHPRDARVPDGALPIRALVVADDENDPVGEVVVWVMDGRLSRFQYLRFNEKAPHHFPPPTSIRVRLRGRDWSSEGIDWRDESFDDALVRAWLADTRSSEKDGDVAQRVWELTHEDLDPARGWRLVKRLIEISRGRELWYVGGGPLASMVANHLDLVEDELVALYRTNPRCRRAFEGQMSTALADFKRRFGWGYWGSVSPDELLDQVREAVELLAAPATQQIDWLHGARVPVEELVLQYEDMVPGWLTRLREGAGLDTDAEAALRDLLSELNGIPQDPDSWTDEALTSATEWKAIRSAASRVVDTFPTPSQ